MLKEKSNAFEFPPIHISARCINKQWFDLPLEQVWRIFENYLFFVHHAFEIEIISFVLMSNHFHLLVRVPQGNLSQAMNYFMRETSRQIGRDAGRINQTYGGRYFRCYIHSNNYFLSAYKYVYRNPVESGAAKKVEDYKFSSLYAILGGQHSMIPIAQDQLLFSDIAGTLHWLNAGRESSNYLAMKSALKKKKMEFGNDRKTRKPHILTTDLY